MSKPYEAKARVRALLEEFTGWPAPAPTIAWAEPLKPEDYQDGTRVIWFTGDLEVDSTEQRMGRSGWTDEFDLAIVVDVFRDGDDAQAAEADADQLYDALLHALGTDPSLSGVIAAMEGWTSRRIVGPLVNGWRCQIVVQQSLSAVVSNPAFISYP